MRGKLIAALALLMSVLLLSGSGGYVEYAEAEGVSSVTLAEVPAAGEWTKYAENSRYELWLLDTGKLLNLSVCDKQSGHMWYANPFTTEEEADTLTDRIKSQLSISYNDTSSAEQTMNSYKHCVAKSQYSVYQTESGLLIQYVIGAPLQDRVVPQVITSVSFEKDILNKVDEKAAKRLKAFYQLKSLDDISSEEMKQTWLDSYPALQDYDLYILKEINTKIRLELEGYIQQSGYTYEQMQEEYERLGYAAESAEEASFLVPVSFDLEEDGLSVSILNQDVYFNSALFSLHKISLLEFFGAANQDDDGYIFLPDGSGSIVSFKSEFPRRLLTQTGKLYGRDITDLEDTGENIYYRYPVFGLVNGENACLAILRQNESGALITTELANSTHLYNITYPVYVYANRVQAASGDLTDPIWNLYEKSPSTVPFNVLYSFLSGDNASYYGMAQKYRAYLEGLGMEKKDEAQKISLFVETMGSMDSRQKVLMIPVQRETALTTFADNERLLSYYHEQQIENVNLRLSGWYNGGYAHTVTRSLSVSNVLGGKKALIELRDLSKEYGYQLFPDVDLLFFSKTALGDGYSQKNDGLRTVDSRLAVLTMPNPASLELDDSRFWYTVNSQSVLNNAAAFMKQYDKLGIGAVSYSAIGRYLSGSYTKSRTIHRQEAAADMQTLLQRTTGEVLTDGYNAYLYPYVHRITGLPTSDSGVCGLGESVLFLQMVLRNYIQYSTEAMNMAGDFDAAVLRTIEYGASPCFTLAFQNFDKLREDRYLAEAYSPDAQYWMQKSAEVYHRIQQALKPVEGEDIVWHEQVSNGVFRTVYSNHISILCNYTDEPFVYEGVTVGAMQYGIWEE